MAEKGLLVDTQTIIFNYAEIIHNAEKHCVICTPFYKPIPEIENAIFEGTKRGVFFWVYICAGYDKQFASLENNPNILIADIESLHGKIIANESEMIISSLNFTESSVDNLEFAYRTDDKHQLEKFYAFIRRGLGFGLNSYGRSLDMNNPFKQCKKCGMTLPNEKGVDFCNACYFKNKGINFPDEEKEMSVCRKCSKPIPTDPRKPFCYECYKTLTFEEKQNINKANCKSCGTVIPNNPYKPFCYSCYLKLNTKNC